MKKAFFSILFFAALFAAQGQRSVEPQPTTITTPKDSVLKVYFWVEGKGIKSLTCNVVRYDGDRTELISYIGTGTATFYVPRGSVSGITTKAK